MSASWCLDGGFGGEVKLKLVQGDFVPRFGDAPRIARWLLKV